MLRNIILSLCLIFIIPAQSSCIMNAIKRIDSAIFGAGLLALSYKDMFRQLPQDIDVLVRYSQSELVSSKALALKTAMIGMQKLQAAVEINTPTNTKKSNTRNVCAIADKTINSALFIVYAASFAQTALGMRNISEVKIGNYAMDVRLILIAIALRCALEALLETAAINEHMNNLE